ncbi:hypothetical protein [Elioraea sp.]|uniref:hypothetical protein n=1 Tax=Elioraea sp. TaxID=2185103 RepID=UPI0025B93562|nr:hypothetical protein [Elioraea sp.]
MATQTNITPAGALRAELEEAAQLARGISEVAATLIDINADPPMRDDEGTSPCESVRWAADAMVDQIEAVRRRLPKRGGGVDDRAESALANLADGAATLRTLVRALRYRMPNRKHPLVHLALRTAREIEAALATAYDRTSGINTGHPLVRVTPEPTGASAAAAREDAEADASIAAPARLH